MKKIINNSKMMEVLIFAISITIVFLSCVSSRAKSSSQKLSEPVVEESETHEPEFELNQIIIKLTSEADENLSIRVDDENKVVTGLDSLDQLNERYDVIKMKPLLKQIDKKSKRKLTSKVEQKRQGLLRLYKIKLGKNTDLLEAVLDYQDDPNVEYAEPNYLYQINSMITDNPDLDTLCDCIIMGRSMGVSSMRTLMQREPGT